MAQRHVLVISDDASFAQSVVARWQTGRHASVLTHVSSDLSKVAALDGYELAIIGPVHEGALKQLVHALEGLCALVCVCSSSQESRALVLAHPATICVPQQDNWLDILMLLSKEILKRLDAEAHARQAHRLVPLQQNDSVLGRSVVEMSHIVNDALTSLLGNADLLLLAPESLSQQSREQIRTIRSMALRLNEVMQHLTLLMTEFRATEKESHSETTGPVSLRLAGE